MLQIFKQSIANILQRLGYVVVSAKPGHRGSRNAALPPDFDDAGVALYRHLQPFTTTSPERIFADCQSVEYVVDHHIPGDIVECGMWKGGSMMAVARVLMERRVYDRKMHLFDTFEGMAKPTEADEGLRGEVATELYGKIDDWCRSPLDEVKRNMHGTGYDPEKMVFVEGKIEQTLPAHAPDRISLLRLDTDWYESTYHELVHLYPRLSVGGVLIIDDYGHWAGARKAVDQYIDEHQLKLLLHRVDYTARICVKPEP